LVRGLQIEHDGDNPIVIKTTGRAILTRHVVSLHGASPK